MGAWKLAAHQGPVCRPGFRPEAADSGIDFGCDVQPGTPLPSKTPEVGVGIPSMATWLPGRTESHHFHR